MDNLLLLSKGNYLAQSADVFDAGGLIIGATTYSRETSTSGKHCHENAHISFVLRGGSIEKRNATEVERLPGNIEFYYSGEAHQTIQKLYPAKNIVLEIDHCFLKKTGITECMIDQSITQNPDGKFLLLKMYKELLAKDDVSDTAINMLFLDMISTAEHNKPGKKIPAWVKAIKELMYENWNEKLTLQDLAIAANVHPVTVSKHFRKYFYCSFGEYMRKLKIERSLVYLKANPNSLTNTAYTCNFADQSHFTRTFKALTGFLPKQYHKL